MNVIIPFLPFLILVFVIVFLVKKYANRNKLTVKVTHWLFLIYVVVLLTATVVSPFITDKKITYKEWTPHEKIAANREMYQQNLLKGQLKQLDHVRKSDSFKYDKLAITLEFASMDSSPHIYVERKDTNDGQIDVYAFTSGIYINGLNFSDELQPLDFSLNGNTLSMSQVLKDTQFSADFSEMYDVNVSIIKSEFPMTQFSEGMGIFGSIDRAGMDIYLQVPKDLKITNASEYAVVQVSK